MSPQRRLVTVSLLLCPLVVGVVAELALHRAETGDAVDVALRGSVDQRVVKYLHTQRVAQHVPGMELTIVRNGRISTAWAEGEARPGTPITPATAVQLASVSKSLTAVAVMQLVGSRALRLDEPVVTYLPRFTTADRDASATITVRDLLHHTSGLDDDAIDTSHLLDDHSSAALERGMRAMADSDLAFSPGHGFLYADANYDLLGLLVQQRSGQRFSDYLREHVFAPMGMTNTNADPVTAIKDGAADGYYRWFGVAYRPTTVPHPLSHQPSAMIYASAVDLAHELFMNLGGGTVNGTAVLTPRLVRQLHKSGADVDGFNGYAAGWYVRPLFESGHPATYDGHSADLPMVYEHSGSAPTTTTFLGFVPFLHLGVVVLMNSHDPDASSRLYALRTNVWKILLDHKPTPLGGPNETFLGHQGPVIGITLLAFLLAMLVATTTEVAARRRTTTARRWLVLVAALAVDLAVMYFVWVYVPHQMSASVHTITRVSPDIAILIWVGTALVVLWAPIRTYLLARPHRQLPKPTLPLQVAPRKDSAPWRSADPPTP